MKRFLFGLFLLSLFHLAISTPLFPDSGKSSRKIVLDFAGDIMAHVKNLVIPDYETPYREIAPLLKNDDLSFANLEFVIDETTPVLGYPRFNVHREYVEAAIDSGFDVFSVANNHIYDLGLAGVFQTLKSIMELKKEYNERVYFSGIRGNTLRDFRPVAIDVRGVRVGFVAVTQFLNRLEKSPYVFVIDYCKKSDREKLLRYVEKWSKKFEVFILSYHGGREYSLKPDKLKVKFFHELIERGVDIVYSHHPHVLQRFKLVRRNGYAKLVLYSTGNLLSAMVYRRDYTSNSAIFRVYCRVDTKSRCSVERVERIPVTNFRDKDKGIVIKMYKLQ